MLGLPAGVFVREVPPSDWTSNAAGQLVLAATLGGPGVSSLNDDAVLAWDPVAGLAVVAREGDLLDVGGGVRKAAAVLRFEYDTGGGDGMPRSLNDHGEFVFHARFADNATAVYSITVPEPAIGGGLVLATWAAIGRRRDRRRS